MLDQNMEQKKIKNYKKVFLNSIMRNGKGNLSENLFIELLKGMQKKSKKNCILILKLAFKNILTPISNVTIKKRKRKIKKSYIPFILRKEKRIPKAIKSICCTKDTISFNGTTFLNNILKLANNKGLLKTHIKVKNNTSFLNKNLAHFRWF